MTRIDITPAQLRQIADVIDDAAQRVSSSTQEVSGSVDGAIVNERFRGALADHMVQRFYRLQSDMEGWQPFLMVFSAFLRESATAFQQADDTHRNGFSGGGGGGGTAGGFSSERYQFDAGKWIRDLNEWLSMDESARKPLVKKINSILLALNPEMKAKWMQFLGDNGYFALAHALSGGLDFASTGNAAELAKGVLITAEALLMGDGKPFDFVKYTTEGVIDFAATGDTSTLLEGVFKGGAYAFIPGVKEVMAFNAGAQVIGHGAAFLVDTFADQLAFGDPVIADGFRHQASSLGDAVDRMDLNNAFEVTADTVVAMFSGEKDLGTAVGNTLEEYANIAGGGVETVFELAKIQTSIELARAKNNTNIWMDVLQIDESVQTNVNVFTDQLIHITQNTSISDVGPAANQLLDMGGDVLVEASTHVDNLLDAGGDLIENLWPL